MAVLNLIVGASGKDARNLVPNSTYTATAATHHLGKFSTTAIYYNGWMWDGVTIPQGAIISSAIMTFYVSNVNGGTTAKTIFYGEDVDSPAAFGNTTAGKPEGRVHTTANVPVDFATADWTSVGYTVTLDVTAIVQEIIDRGGWASGNSLVIVATDNGSANTNYVGYATYNNASNKATKLDITYTTDVTTTQTITGVARIQKVVNQTVTGKARIQKSASQTVTGKARIQKAVAQTVLGTARIQKVVSRTITGVASIVSGNITTPQTIAGVARIQKVVNQTVQGKARIQVVTPRTVQGVSRIQKVVAQTLAG